jgi:SET domain-containing protein
MPNARVDQDHANRLLKLVALRNIAKGEEITVDYAIDLWFKPES